jgi:hypothetical protein
MENYKFSYERKLQGPFWKEMDGARLSSRSTMMVSADWIVVDIDADIIDGPQYI